MDRIEVSSTSKAAEMASKDPDGVAIASRIAADVHNMSVLASNIEDSPDNTTRFLIISATVTSQPTPPDSGHRDKTLLSFTLDHQQPGALCDSLQTFKVYGLNLTSISSRPSRVIPWNYIFFVEFEGHKQNTKVKDALYKMEEYCISLRVLGSYRDRSRKALGTQ